MKLSRAAGPHFSLPRDRVLTASGEEMSRGRGAPAPAINGRIMCVYMHVIARSYLMPAVVLYGLIDKVASAPWGFCFFNKAIDAGLLWLDGNIRRA